MRTIFGVIAVLVGTANLPAAVPEFEPNAGQAETQFAFLSRISGKRVWIENSAIVFSNPAIRLRWVDALQGPGWSASEPTGNSFRYCNLPASELCAKTISTYSRLKRTALYPGIDWLIYGRESNLEYDLVLQPGADARALRLRVEGAAAHVDGEGRLRTGDLLHWRPEAYQTIDGKKVLVAAELRRMDNGDFGFHLGEYRRDRELIIDPVIEPLFTAGGAAEDSIAGTYGVEQSSILYSYGTTRSGDWSRSIADTGRDIFVQASGASGRNTVFWGGSGDEEIGGAEGERTNGRLLLAGWTSSQDALMKPAGLRSRPYAGGATDGFVLEFRHGAITFATYVGGPGADRVHDIRFLGNGALQGFAMVGETGNPDWPGVLVEKLGPGGAVDAFAGIVEIAGTRLMIIGGTGEDRAVRLRTAGTELWAVGGETDSTDFPLIEGAAAAAGRDVWTGLLQRDSLRWTRLALFGGSGTDRLAGIGILPEMGFYVAGTTDSPDLPAAKGAYQGGASDGFVAHLDPISGAAVSTNYIGGSGTDEIATMEASAGDLLLGGGSDSAELNVTNLPRGDQASKGRMDGLFVQGDATAAPIFGLRIGGTGDDRVLGVEALALGKVRLSGWSESGEWLSVLDPYRAPGARDGFAVEATFAALKVSLASPYLGLHLQSMMLIEAATEPGMDGILVIRSSDPSKLLVSTDPSIAGTGTALVPQLDTPEFQGGRRVYLQALAAEGEVDVILEPRSSAPTLRYPQRTVRVKLAPSALFLSHTREIRTQPRQQILIKVDQAAVLPDGKPGPAQRVRAGLKHEVTLLVSDPSVLLRGPGFGGGFEGAYEFSLHSMAEGVFSATPSSPLIPTAPGQAVSIRSSATANRVFYEEGYNLAKDHLIELPLLGSAGDTLRIVSSDPGRVRIGLDQANLSDSSEIRFDSANRHRALWVEGLDREGTITLHAVGTLAGKAVEERVLIRLVGYKASLPEPFPPLGVGRQIIFGVTYTPQVPQNDPAFASIFMRISPRLAAGVSLRSSNPAVLEVSREAGPSYAALARSPGIAIIEFAPGAPAEVAQVRLTVEVVPLALNAGLPEIVIPAGSAIPLPIESNGGAEVLKRIRLRLSDGSPFTLQHLERGTDLVLDYTRNYAVMLEGDKARAGQQATLFVSAAGVPEYAIPIRVVEAVLLPRVQRVQAQWSRDFPSAATGVLSYEFAGYENGRTYPVPFGSVLRSTVTVRLKSSNAGVCEFPGTSGVVGNTHFISIRFQCTGVGSTRVALEAADLSSAQPQFEIEVIAGARPATPLLMPARVLTGAGVQAQLITATAYDSSFRGSVTSNDPERVRLSLDPQVLGSASVDITRAVPVYVQGFGSEGVVTLRVQSTDGRTAEIPVHLFPATMAVRPLAESVGWQQDLSGTLSMERALSEANLVFGVSPYLVDTATGKLIFVRNLQVRGGTEPRFLPAQSSEVTVAEPAPATVLFNEGTEKTELKVRAHKIGETVLSVSQPEGFISVPESSLRVRVFEHELTLGAVILSRDMQIPAEVRPKNANPTGSEANVVATVTSLHPEKLLIAPNDTATGESSLRVSMSRPMYLQATGAAVPGETLRVRLEAPGYAASEAEVQIAPAELQVDRGESQPVQLRPESTNQAIQLVYGPVNPADGGLVYSGFNGSMRPGVNLSVGVSSSDPSVLQAPEQPVALARLTRIPVRSLRPGRAQLRFEASPGIVNVAGVMDVVVLPYSFANVSHEAPGRFLVSGLTVRNPRSEPVTLAVDSPTSNVLFGTAKSGSGAPSSSVLNVPLAANESRTIYFEPTRAGTGPRAAIRLTAPDFTPWENDLHPDDPTVRFDSPGPLVAALANASVTVGLRVGLGWGDQPLGGSIPGPLRVQLQSSNPQVLRAPASPVEIRPGENRTSAVLQLVGRGDAVITITVPSGFNGGQTAQSLLVTVR